MSEKNYIIISVTDFGIGISKAAIAHILTSFARRENVDLIRDLSIVNQVIDALGGEIIMNITLGKGESLFLKFQKNKNIKHILCLKY